MANQRPIRTRRWRPWRGRRKIPMRAIQKLVQWIPVGTLCEPLPLHQVDAEDACSDLSSFRLLELVPSGGPGAGSPDNFMTVHGLNVSVHVVIDRAIDRPCDSFGAFVFEMGSQSSHLRWYLARFKGAEYDSAIATDPNLRAKYDPFKVHLFSGQPDTPISQHDPLVLDWGESVRVPTWELKSQSAWDPADPTPCDSVEDWLKPDGTVDAAAQHFQASLHVNGHHAFHVKQLWKKGLTLSKDDALVLAIGLKSWYSDRLLSSQFSAYGRMKVSFS